MDHEWRNITEPVLPAQDPSRPEFVQVIYSGRVSAYPICLDRDVTRVIPPGGLPMPEVDSRQQRSTTTNLASRALNYPPREWSRVSLT